MVVVVVVLVVVCRDLQVLVEILENLADQENLEHQEIQAILVKHHMLLAKPLLLPHASHVLKDHLARPGHLGPPDLQAIRAIPELRLDQALKDLQDPKVHQDPWDALGPKDSQELLELLPKALVQRLEHQDRLDLQDHPVRIMLFA